MTLSREEKIALVIDRTNQRMLPMIQEGDFEYIDMYLESSTEELSKNGLGDIPIELLDHLVEMLEPVADKLNSFYGFLGAVDHIKSQS